jgi:hypothetical protein
VPLVGMSEDLVAEGFVTSLARPGGISRESVCSRQNSTANDRTF